MQYPHIGGPQGYTNYCIIHAIFWYELNYVAVHLYVICTIYNVLLYAAICYELRYTAVYWIIGKRGNRKDPLLFGLFEFMAGVLMQRVLVVVVFLLCFWV